ncbi:hypothetical protein [Deinococcus cellulosilyticus]|nr:hypothetical protein [Deinococcus cellulosilyticus]
MDIKENTPGAQLVQTLFLKQSTPFIQHCTDQMELARAKGAREAVIREQIKAEVMKTAQHMLESVLMQVRKARHGNP